MNILIFGATGFIGSEITRILLQTDNKIFVLQHSQPTKNNTKSNLEIISGDALDYSSYSSINNIDIVINCIGIIKEKKDFTFKKAHIDIVKNILMYCKEKDIKHFIQISALGAQKDSETKYFQTKYQAEQLIKQSGINYTILQPSIVWGKEGFKSELEKLVRFPLFTPIIGNGKYKFQPIKVDDLAKDIVNIIKNINDEKYKNQTLKLGGENIYSLRDLIINIEKEHSKKKIHFYVPISILKLFANIAEKIHLPFPVSNDQLKMIEIDNVV